MVRSATGAPYTAWARICRRGFHDLRKRAELGRKSLLQNPDLTHERTHEYGSYIMEAILTASFIGFIIRI